MGTVGEAEAQLGAAWEGSSGEKARIGQRIYLPILQMGIGRPWATCPRSHSAGIAARTQTQIF